MLIAAAVGVGAAIDQCDDFKVEIDTPIHGTNCTYYRDSGCGGAAYYEAAISSSRQCTSVIIVFRSLVQL